MFEQKKRRQDYYMKNKILSEVGKEASGKEVLDYLMGDEYDDSDYVVYKYRYDKRTLLNRINLFWVAPLFMVFNPVVWLLNGTYGVRRDSRLGHIVDRLIKLD